MGMFDEVKCEYPLPWPDASGFDWQSKDTPAQYLDHYEIRADGTLWHEAYEMRIEETDAAPFGFWMHRDNRRWEQVQWSGELEIHHYITGYGYYSVRFWFRDGRVADVIPTFRPKEPTSPVEQPITTDDQPATSAAE